MLRSDQGVGVLKMIGRLQKKSQKSLQDSLLRFRDFKIMFSSCLFALCLAIAGYVYISDGIIFMKGTLLLGRDFVNYYSASEFLHNGNVIELYDVQLYFDYLKQTYGEKFTLHNSSYPPHFLLLNGLWAFFPYAVAYALWCIIGTVIFGMACNQFTVNKVDAVILALAPATFLNIYFGQNGFFTGALILATFAVLPKRPILAGLFLALLTIKPHLGVLFPLILLLSRQYKAFASAGFFTTLFIGSSVLIFGPDIWVTYFTETIPLQKEILIHAGGPFKFMVPSFFQTGQLLGLPEQMGWALQTVSSVIVLVSVIWVWIRKRDYKLQVAFTCIAIMMLSPYIVIYDFMLLAPAAYLYFAHFHANEDQPKGQLYIRYAIFIGLLPLTSIAINVFYFPVTPIIMFGFGYEIIQRLRALPSDAYGPWVPRSLRFECPPLGTLKVVSVTP